MSQTRRRPTQAVVMPVGPSAVRAARRVVFEAYQAAGTEPSLAQDAVLLVSEVRTNAVLHGSGPQWLTVTPGAGGGMYVAAADHDRGCPNLRGDDRDALNGRGLRLIGAVAARPGVRPDPGTGVAAVAHAAASRAATALHRVHPPLDSCAGARSDDRGGGLGTRPSFPR